MFYRALIEGLGGTVWRSQAVVFARPFGLPVAAVDRYFVGHLPPVNVRLTKH